MGASIDTGHGIISHQVGRIRMDWYYGHDQPVCQDYL